ncbi:MAG: hypothetical protein KME20_08410 [Kaiparowitsia implicata GSE-PSE-MK54-09C]|nr:hypothetical protein [Kaiparowitsia implicata GSE-PSE-MK54-09C]
MRRSRFWMRRSRQLDLNHIPIISPFADKSMVSTGGGWVPWLSAIVWDD